jgi:hypothetical protein
MARQHCLVVTPSNWREATWSSTRRTFLGGGQEVGSETERLSGYPEVTARWLHPWGH